MTPRTAQAQTILVTVPPTSDLSEPQRCGRSCVWCSRALAVGHSVDVGERDDETGRHWFPRGCPLCSVEHVYRQLIEHASSCEQCVDNGGLCPASAELRRALKEGRAQ
ncbi:MULTISPECIES: hypothetical protein [unclassified Streptomyces]|uniref:hypothetical protein n=1 Tax=unclassified Streptomyces TaxID=2593676 RepID=UPI002E189425|nr:MULTISPECIES: hypothetical protein [unclassified Streptomyces]